MIVVTVSRENADLLWKGPPGDGRIESDGAFTFKGAAQPIEPPYTIVVAEDKDEETDEDKG